MSVSTETPVTVRLSASEFLNMRLFFENLDVGRVQREIKELANLKAVNKETDALLALLDRAEENAESDGTRVMTMTKQQFARLHDMLDRTNLAAIIEATPGLTLRALIRASSEFFNGLVRSVTPPAPPAEPPADPTAPPAVPPADPVESPVA
jgi:hypothetical protein